MNLTTLKEKRTINRDEILNKISALSKIEIEQSKELAKEYLTHVIIPSFFEEIGFEAIHSEHCIVTIEFTTLRSNFSTNVWFVHNHDKELKAYISKGDYSGIVIKYKDSKAEFLLKTPLSEKTTISYRIYEKDYIKNEYKEKMLVNEDHDLLTFMETILKTIRFVYKHNANPN